MQVAGRAALACPLVALAKEEAREERAGECTSPEKTDTEIWFTVCGSIRTLHFIQGRNPA
jgi:hypothetical protein